LRINLRGADRSGEDIYHAGLTADLHATMASPEVSRHPVRLLVGYSMGGHLSLRAAAEDPKVAHAIAAICSPLDLESTVRHLDHPLRAPYRRYVLSGLREVHAATAARRGLPISAREARAIKTIRAWDDAVVAPRFGFSDALDYYRRMSAGPLLSQLTTPTLFLAGVWDPMVVADALRPHLALASPALEVRWIERGGHVHFPPWSRADAMVLDWLLARAQGSSDRPSDPFSALRP
jgi:predicted alpha/beta-fold hydrolase